MLVLFKATLFAFISTITSILALKFVPSFVVAVILHVPLLTAFITPVVELTVAILESLLFHVTFLFAVFSGNIFGLNEGV